MVIWLRRCSIVALLLMSVTPAAGQTFESVGTRAAGMGGAFVAVADDASAAYWNPAGFALGNPFSMVLDHTMSRVEEGSPNEPTFRGSASLVALGMPALGLSYYQLRSVSVTPLDVTTGSDNAGRQTSSGLVRLDRLVTHNTGVTLVQSLARGVALGTTLKLVHGTASTAIVQDGDREGLVDRAGDLEGEGVNKFDSDIGVIAGGGRLKLGLTVRNLTEPSFKVTSTSDTLRLRRQVRAGVAVSIVQGWAVATDFDLTSNGSAEAQVRSFAAGTEGRVGQKVLVRSGFRLSTTGASRPSVAAGGTYVVMKSILIDGQATWGSENADRGWGIAARFVY
jgi:hypothetical protein